MLESRCGVVGVVVVVVMSVLGVKRSRTLRGTDAFDARSILNREPVAWPSDPVVHVATWAMPTGASS